MVKLPAPITVTVEYSMDEPLRYMSNHYDNQHRFWDRIGRLSWVNETCWNHNSWITFTIKSRNSKTIEKEISKRHFQLQKIINTYKRRADKYGKEP